MCCRVRVKLGQIKNSITDECKHTHTHAHVHTRVYEHWHAPSHPFSLNTHTSVTGSCRQYLWVLNMAALTALLSLQNTLKLRSNLQLGFRVCSQLFVLLSVSCSSGIFTSRFTMFLSQRFYSHVPTWNWNRWTRRQTQTVCFQMEVKGQWLAS